LPIPSASKDPTEEAETKNKRQKVCAANDTDETVRPAETSELTPDARPESTTEFETQREEATTKDTPVESANEFAANRSSEENMVVDGNASPDKMDCDENKPDTGKLHHAEQEGTHEPGPLYLQPKEADGDDSDDDDDDFLPEIVDCGPDEEDR
jgi:hypothetical protein